MQTTISIIHQSCHLDNSVKYLFSATPKLIHLYFFAREDQFQDESNIYGFDKCFGSGKF